MEIFPHEKKKKAIKCSRVKKKKSWKFKYEAGKINYQPVDIYNKGEKSKKESCLLRGG